MSGNSISIDGQRMTLEQAESIADGARCALTSKARRTVRASRAVVDRAVRSGKQVYGVNTGFGRLAKIRIDDDRLDELQLNLVRSHCAGVGEPLPERCIRMILALRANCLSRGHSGLRLETLESLISMLDHGIHPVVPCQGSVNASGDLAPLAHIALALIGEGEVFHQGRRVSASRAWKKVGALPVRLQSKEGLALINGTQVTCAIGIEALLKAERLATLADIVGAMSLEALMGSHKAFDRRIHQARPQTGQALSAANLRKILRGSAINRSHRACDRVQDSYSLRCIPQVHGAVRDSLSHVRKILEIEVNSSTDNPMVFAEQDEMLSGGNFHGQPVSIALDHLGTAVCSLGTISERRIDRLLHPDKSGLPAFLAHEPGIDSGFMLAHVTAAALVSENKVLAHPASVDTIPTSAGKEDHVAMGAHAARKAAQIVDHVATVLAIEMICAAQALDLLTPLRAGKAVQAAHGAVRGAIRTLKRDRVQATDIGLARGLVDRNEIRLAVESTIGALR